MRDSTIPFRFSGDGTVNRATILTAMSLLFTYNMGRTPAYDEIPFGPLAAVGYSEYYVGLLPQQEDPVAINGTFRLKNTAPQSLSARVESNCGCSTPLLFAGLIEPGAIREIDPHLTTLPNVGVPDIKDFPVFVGPATTPVGHFQVLAKRLTGLSVFPDRNVVLQAAFGAETTKRLFLVALDKRDLSVDLDATPSSFVDFRVEPGVNPVNLQLPEIVFSNGSVFGLTVTVRETAPLGSHFETLRLRTNYPGAEMLSILLLLRVEDPPGNRAGPYF